MARVVGIGGIFFKAQEPDALREWYRANLGLDMQSWGAVTVWTIFPSTSTYFAPSAAPFMISYRVDNLTSSWPTFANEAALWMRESRSRSSGGSDGYRTRKAIGLELWEPPSGGFSG